ncbi:MAG: GWxTD domain-containing protein, partial [Balneolaceae bacterium]|nr:GWxTD domain-containing protein [Balneolaceae bacterium]
MLSLDNPLMRRYIPGGIYLFVSMLLVLFTTVSAEAWPQQISPSADDYYQRGMQQVDAGNIERALQIWEQAKESDSEADYRIGLTYLEQATGNSLRGYYRKASEIYLWGLRDDRVEHAEKALEKELDYMGSMVPYPEYKRIKDKIKDKDSSIYDDLLAFWNRKDPTPLTDYNERLIEHWERVAKAKKLYGLKNKRGFDHRGDLYIRYGPPDYKREGMIVYNSGTVHALLQERIGVDFPNLRGNPQSNSIKSARMFNMETVIRSLHSNPRYEVWIYETLTNSPEHTIFMFGTDDGSPTFRRKKSLEDFIPNAAYSRRYRDKNLITNSPSSVGSSGQQSGTEATAAFDQFSQNASQSVPRTDITPALILQMMYYEQFSALDHYFGDAYGRMLSRYLDLNSRIPFSLTREFEQVNENDLIQRRSKAPEEISVYQRNISEIPMHTYT